MTSKLASARLYTIEDRNEWRESRNVKYLLYFSVESVRPLKQKEKKLFLAHGAPRIIELGLPLALLKVTSSK